jgi:putative transposase
MEESDIKRLYELEDENRLLKQMYTVLNLEHTILKDIIGKKCKANYGERTGRLRRSTVPACAWLVEP